MPKPKKKQWEDFDGWESKTPKGPVPPRCYESHPPLEIAPGLTIYGGSCISPIVKDADIYIGFDSGMRPTSKIYPWTEGEEVFFRIQDMDIPTSPSEFENMVQWTASRLKEGKKIHCGCIGGHGRTGMFLAALRARLVPADDDPITFVRVNYCKKAVENSKQVNFLHATYGAKKVEGSKADLFHHAGWGSYEAKKPTLSKITGGKLQDFDAYKPTKPPASGKIITTGGPLNEHLSIWSASILTPEGAEIS